MKKLLILVLILSCGAILQEATAQAPHRAAYKPGLLQYFLQKDLQPIKSQLNLTKIQSASFDQICNHYRKKVMISKGQQYSSKNAKKKAIKETRKEQDATIKTILKSHQYQKYLALMANYRRHKH